MVRQRTLAEVYRQFVSSPLNERIAVAISESAEALKAIETAPTRKRQPALILAALHDLALAGRAPGLAAAFAGSGDAADAAIDVLLRMTDSVVARRSVRSNETGHYAVLYPAIAEAARRVGADKVGLIDVGHSAGFNLNVDRVGISYSNGQSLGEASSTVQSSCRLVGEKSIPTTAIPEVVARINIDVDPVDVTNEDDARWLRACQCPDQPESLATLDAEIALAATAPPLVMRGDAVELIREAVAAVPSSTLPIVMTTWSMSKFRPERRHSFVQGLRDVSIAWVSVEGVGTAPMIPTLGDRRASGHSIIGLAVSDGEAFDAQAIGRCWSRGQVMSWLD